MVKKGKQSIVAEISTFSCVMIDGKPNFAPDFTSRVLLFNKGGGFVNKGDFIQINSFYVRNQNENCINRFSSFYITEWEVIKRNPYKSKYYDKSSQEQKLKNKMRQRQEIEDELEAEEQDLDEYIDSMDNDDIPF